MGVVIVEGEEAVSGVKLRRPIVTFATRLFSNYFEDLLLLCHCQTVNDDKGVNYGKTVTGVDEVGTWRKN